MNPSLVVLAVVGHRVLVHFLEVGEEVSLVLVLAVHDRRVDVLDADGILDTYCAISPCNTTEILSLQASYCMDEVTLLKQFLIQG